MTKWANICEIPSVLLKFSISTVLFYFSCKDLPGHADLLICWQRLTWKGTVKMKVRWDVGEHHCHASRRCQNSAPEHLTPTIPYADCCPTYPPWHYHPPCHAGELHHTIVCSYRLQRNHKPNPITRNIPKPQKEGSQKLGSFLNIAPVSCFWHFTAQTQQPMPWEFGSCLL